MATPDPRQLFTERRDAYDRFISAVRYPEGLRAFFLASSLLRPGMRVLEAGCGTGALTLAIQEACARRRIPLAAFHAFDLTPAMLDRLRGRLARRSIGGVELAEADVLQLDGLPPAWRGYDLVVSASMLEYVPRDRFVDALRGLRERLADDGRFVLFMTRRNLLTRFLIGRWWRSNLYTAAELAEVFQRAGFSQVEFARFPRAAIHLSVWGHVVQARA